MFILHRKKMYRIFYRLRVHNLRRNTIYILTIQGNQMNTYLHTYILTYYLYADICLCTLRFDLERVLGALGSALIFAQNMCENRHLPKSTQLDVGHPQ